MAMTPEQQEQVLGLTGLVHLVAQRWSSYRSSRDFGYEDLVQIAFEASCEAVLKYPQKPRNCSLTTFATWHMRHVLWVERSRAIYGTTVGFRSENKHKAPPVRIQIAPDLEHKAGLAREVEGASAHVELRQLAWHAGLSDDDMDTLLRWQEPGALSAKMRERGLNFNQIDYRRRCAWRKIRTAARV